MSLNIPENLECTLCHKPGVFFREARKRKYYICENCGAVLMYPQFYLSADDERERYLKHNNKVDDICYQNFGRPLAEEIKQNYSREHSGLDFGAGTGPVIAKMLRDSGYQAELYDPFFWNFPKLLESQYDYVICSEVIEHFKDPDSEFRLLRSLLKKNGTLLCKTTLFKPDTDFDRWHYKNDPTHLIFYTEKSLNLIRSKYSFTELIIKDEFIKFTV